MTDTVIISDGETETDNADIIDAVEQLEGTVEETVEQLEETVEDAIEQIADTVNEQEDKLSWLVTSVSIMTEQIQTLSEAVATMATSLIPPPSPDPETEVMEIAEPMNISETTPETSSIPLQDDLENVANPETTLNQEVRKIIKI